MTEKLKNKIALITGGSSGIGLEAAKIMIAEGAFVYITGRRKNILEQAVQTLGSQAVGIQADVSIKQDMTKVYTIIKEQAGKLDIIFANAGIGKYIQLADIQENDIDQTFDVNVKGVIFTVQTMIPLLTKGSSIILNTSITADLGLPDFSLYAASKAAVRSFVHSWTTDLKNKRIRVNAVSPGVIPTAAATGELGRSKTQELERQQWRASLTPLGRTGQVHDVAEAVLFLASDDSDYITGIELTVDGGLSAAFANKL